MKKALHVLPDAHFFNGDNGDGFDYSSTEQNLMPFHAHVALDTELRALIYNGDSDSCSLSSGVMQNWTASLGLKEVEAWRPWTMDGGIEMGGYVTRYQGHFDVVSIRGAGHLVPLYEPGPAFTLISSWVAGEVLPPYVKPKGQSKMLPVARV